MDGQVVLTHTLDSLSVDVAALSNSARSCALHQSGRAREGPVYDQCFKIYCAPWISARFFRRRRPPTLTWMTRASKLCAFQGRTSAIFKRLVIRRKGQCDSKRKTSARHPRFVREETRFGRGREGTRGAGASSRRIASTRATMNDEEFGGRV